MTAMDPGRPDRIVEAYRSFFAGDRPDVDPVALFHRVAASVPAYKSFLDQHGVRPETVRTPADFRRLPMTSKQAYQSRYPLPELCRDGRLDGNDMVAVSSGSSGTPTVWPRSLADELQVAARFEQVFRDGFGAADRSTLAVRTTGSRWFSPVRCSASSGVTWSRGERVSPIRCGRWRRSTAPPTRACWGTRRRCRCGSGGSSPAGRYFEEHEGTLLFSADGGVPLVRYHIADQGGVLSYDELTGFCGRHGLVLDGPDQPFLYVFGRSLFTVSYYGANVYPENVTVGLEQPGISDWVTGKFVLETYEDADADRRLRVTVELVEGRDGDPEYFPAGVKHRYTRPS